MGVGPGLCERLELLVAPAPSHKPFGYESRSLRLPFFSLALPFLCSELPSLFLLLSPVRAPPASFIRPLVLSIVPSSCLLCCSCLARLFLLQGLVDVYLYSLSTPKLNA